MKALRNKHIKKLVEATLSSVASKGGDFFSWKNSPEVKKGLWTQVQGWGEKEEIKKISSEEAKDIFEEKLNGAYAERFAMSVGTVAALVGNGYNIRIVQFQEETGTPFDAEGWCVIVVETMPVFHVAPWDLDTSKLEDIVEVLADNSTKDVSWKGTNKIGEFKALLQGSITPNLDLVSIAKEASK